MGDKERMGQVLTNIISNAIKYSPQGGKIIVTLKNKKDQALVSVEDKGIGIPKEKQSKIFERFFRAQDKGEYQGLGIGLYISAEILKRHCGNLYVESTEGKGSKFTFTLPLKETNATANN